MKKSLYLLTVLVFVVPSLSADGFSSLQEQMTGIEFTTSGLDKLSDKELEALNEWISNHSLGTLDVPKSAETAAVKAEDVPGGDTRGLTGDKSDDKSPIRSQILGEFDGWDGQTVFRLENGMIWVQDDNDKVFVRDAENPIAVIEQGMFGTWRLQIEGHDAQCKVKRIE